MEKGDPNMKSLVRSLRNLGVGAGLLLCGGLVANPALAGTTADTITYNFLGTVTSVGPGLPQNEFREGLINSRFHSASCSWTDHQGKFSG